MSRAIDDTAVPVIPGVEDLEPIGRGGFGVVYRGRQPELAREVAVKVVQSPAAQGSAVDRWRREIEAMGRLSNHPNIVAVYSGGLTESGLPYLVMPFVPGGSLHDRVRQEGPLPAGEVASMGAKLAAALAAAHEVGVLHRDVKPDNVLLSPYGEPQLSDFGIARLLDASTTATGTIHATIRYAAPEVLSGQPATEASDVYGLGATLYTCLAGTPPFGEVSDESIVALVGRIASEDPVDLRAVGVPADLASVIEHALAKSPEGRIRTADELRGRLAAVADELDGRGETTQAIATPATRMLRDEHEQTAVVPVAAAPRRARPVPPPAARSGAPGGLAVAIVAVLLLIGLVAVLLYADRERDGADDDTPATSAPASTAPETTVTTTATAAPLTTPTLPPVVRGNDKKVAGKLEKRATDYFNAIGDERFDDSYAMLSPEFRETQSFEDYAGFWQSVSPVEIAGKIRVDEENRSATVPITMDGEKNEFRLTFVEGDDGTWYVDGPRPA